MAEPLLRTEDLMKSFGGLTAVDNVSLELGDESVSAIIGPNGAGKTTFFNLLTGFIKPSSGSIYFDGEDITDRPMPTIARRGLVRSFQVTNVFEQLTVYENVRNAIHADTPLVHSFRDIDKMPGLNERTTELLERVGLAERGEMVAANLSHGEKRTLEIAITLGADPKLLLLDEPTSGMSGEETQETLELIRSIAEETPVVIIEHKMGVVMNLSERIVVMHNGSVIADGVPAEIREDDAVISAYLGTQE